MRQKINDFTLFTDINVKSEEYARKAYRANPKNLWVYLFDKKEAYEVENISISGLCFKTSDTVKKLLSPRQQVKLILASGKREFLSLTAQIVRVENDSCSCFFPALSEDEEKFLDKLILEMQKHEIMRRKLEREQQLEEHRKKIGAIINDQDK